jgi:cytochrome d ubiquinol oxidase subunit II
MDAIDLPLIWAALISIAIVAYVALDGFDLGVGILFSLERDEADRNVMMNTVAPVWDGNETWLVLGGGGLFAVFPLAYAIIMPAFYPAIITMLLALVFRGVAFEFRFRAASPRGRLAWDFAFFGGSTIAAFCQGLVLGGIVHGVKVENRAYAGGWWDWLTGFSIFCGIAVVLGYALLGATWLIWRTEGALQERCRRYAETLGTTVLALIAVVSLWTPTLNSDFSARWFSFPAFVLAAPVPLLVVGLAVAFFHGLRRPDVDVRPFLCALGWFLLCFVGLGISLFPKIVPPDITIWQAAGPPASLWFLLVGAIVLIPTILAYTAHAYWVFRGKVRAGAHYH